MEILDQPTSTELKIASDGNRIIAYLIDAVLVIMVSIIPFGFILGVAYFITKDALPFLDGQSIGKKVMKIRAVTEEGAPLTDNYGASIVRNIVFMIPFFPIIELIVLLTNDKKQRLGDQWAKTKVVEAEA
jgi:uncharacterized RDD family membrane protein YckC